MDTVLKDTGFDAPPSDVALLKKALADSISKDTFFEISASDPSVPEEKSEDNGLPDTGNSRIKKAVRRKWLPFLGAGAILILVGTGLILRSYTGNVNTYNEAVDLLEAKQYDEAIVLLDELGGFSDAGKLRQYASNCIDYQAAVQAMADGGYSEALAYFEAMSDFRDAKAQADICRTALEKMTFYEEALRLFEEGSYAEAKAQFTAADGLEASKDYLLLCDNALAFEDVCDLLQNGDYSEAVAQAKGIDITALEQLSTYENNYKNWTTYLSAAQALEEGHRYEAYKRFNGLGSFADAADAAKACALEIPKNGVLYRNNEYQKTSVTLQINTPNDGRNNYLKFYSESGDLMLTVFVRANSSYTVQFPGGTFGINIGYGNGSWYGEEDMFGDNAIYQRMSFGENENMVTLSPGEYSLTLRTGNTDGDSVDTKSIGRDQM